MDAIITIVAPTPEELAAVAINRIIERAKALAKDPDCNKWQVYEWAKVVIGNFTTSADSYERAVAALTEALKV